MISCASNCCITYNFCYRDSSDVITHLTEVRAPIQCVIKIERYYNQFYLNNKLSVQNLFSQYLICYQSW